MVSMAVLLSVGGSGLEASGVQSPSPSASPERAVLNRFCVTCHNARLHTAGLQLDTADVDHPGGKVAVGGKGADRLRTREIRRDALRAPVIQAPYPFRKT